MTSYCCWRGNLSGYWWLNLAHFSHLCTSRQTNRRRYVGLCTLGRLVRRSELCIHLMIVGPSGWSDGWSDDHTVYTPFKTHISSLQSQMIDVITFLLATISTIKHKQFDVIIVYTSPRPLPPLIIASRFSFIRLLRRSEAMCRIWKFQFPNTAIVSRMTLSHFSIDSVSLY